MKKTDVQLLIELDDIEAGVAYPADHQRGPSRCKYAAGEMSDLKELSTHLTHARIAELVKAGLVKETIPWGDRNSPVKFQNAILTYAGRLKLLTLNGWMKDGYPAWRKVYSKWICCDKAIPTFCVCMVKTMCPDHGDRCHGTHD